MVVVAVMGWRLHLNPIRFMLNLKRYAAKKRKLLQSETRGSVCCCIGGMDCLLLIKTEYRLVESLRVVRPAARVYRGMELCRIHRPLLRLLSASYRKSPISDGRVQPQKLFDLAIQFPSRTPTCHHTHKGIQQRTSEAITLSSSSPSSVDNFVSKSHNA